MRNILRIFFFIFIFFLAACARAPSFENHTAAETNLILGIGELQQHHSEVAQEKLLQAYQQDPNNPRVVDGLAYFYEWQGETTKAQKFYEQAIQISPDDGGAHNNYGTFLCRQHQYAVALLQFQLAEQSPHYEHPGVAKRNAQKCHKRRLTSI